MAPITAALERCVEDRTQLRNDPTALDLKTNTFGSRAQQRATICRDSMIRLAIMKTDPLEFFPLHKSDVANARALLALGYPALGPHLKKLLEWLQDGNWPISRPIGEFLLTVPEAIAPLIPEVLADLQSRPGMFLRKVTYDSVASCIQGFDLGTGFEFLKGFKEWLCSRATQGHNMSWPVLVLYIAFPESKTPWRNLEDPESEQKAIATLFQCLQDFCSER